MSSAVALMLALVVVAGALAAGSSGARQTRRAIGLIALQGADQVLGEVETGGRSVATALGDDLAITRASVGKYAG